MNHGRKNNTFNSLFPSFQIMAHRVFLKNLKSDMVTTKKIWEFLQSNDFYYVSETDISIKRNNSERWCCAFITLQSKEEVQYAVWLLHECHLPSVSTRTLHAEPAVPRMMDMRASASSKQDDKMHLEVKKEMDDNPATDDQRPTHEPDLQVDKTWTAEQQEDEPHSNVDVAVTHFTKVKKEEREAKKLMGPGGPWKRRRRMRGERWSGNQLNLEPAVVKKGRDVGGMWGAGWATILIPRASPTMHP